MSRPPLAIAAVLLLAAAAGACAPQCTCPTAIPAPAAGPPVAATPMPTPPPAAAPATPPPAAAPAPAPAAGPVRLANEGPALRRMGSVYPRYLSDAGVRGDVVVEVGVDADGRVESANIVSATNDRLRDPALTVAQELRFTAPPAAGTTVRVRLRFQPAGRRIDILP
ncbi:MAG TPA: TonB family protein [Longimicrobium sp.]|nr:TonB family protein [Longimicrobium sp.]